jgi:hypothetical protein
MVKIANIVGRGDHVSGRVQVHDDELCRERGGLEEDRPH